MDHRLCISIQPHPTNKKAWCWYILDIEHTATDGYKACVRDSSEHYNTDYISQAAAKAEALEALARHLNVALRIDP